MGGGYGGGSGGSGQKIIISSGAVEDHLDAVVEDPAVVGLQVARS